MISTKFVSKTLLPPLFNHKSSLTYPSFPWVNQSNGDPEFNGTVLGLLRWADLHRIKAQRSCPEEARQRRGWWIHRLTSL